MSMQTIYAHKTIGITDLKRDSNIIDNLDEPVAILKRDSIKAYLIPERLMEVIADYLDDIRLAKLANQRLDDLENGKTSTIKVNIDEL